MAQATHKTHLALAPQPLCAGLPSLKGHVLAVLTLWIARHRTRKGLARLDVHMLRDIGVSVAEARREANRMFWQG